MSDIEGAATIIEQQAEEITALKRELKDLSDPKLSSMRLENGCLDMSLVSPMIERLATAIGGWFIAGGAKNYVEMRLHDRHETDSVYVVTIQKTGMKTPHDLRREAENKTASARHDALEEAASRLDREWPGPASSIVRALLTTHTGETDEQ